MREGRHRVVDRVTARYGDVCLMAYTALAEEQGEQEEVIVDGEEEEEQVADSHCPSHSTSAVYRHTRAPLTYSPTAATNSTSTSTQHQQ